MYVDNIKAAPGERGGRIDFSWKNPLIEDFPNFKGVKIVRHERRFPETKPPRYASDIGDFIYDGILVQNETDGKESFKDTDLKGETVYYYTFYAYDDDPDPAKIQHFANRSSRVSAMATSTYAIGDELYQLIPAIYKRYDAQQDLKSFLGIFGHQLDLIRSFISGTRTFKDLDVCDGVLLPLLAQWIGWQTNLSLDLDAQRNEVRNAPELYKTVGTIPNLRALVNRLTGWDCRVKEFFHNVLRTNAPPELAIWMQKKTANGWCPAAPFILDAAFEGAPFSLRTIDGTIWLFYHAHGADSSDIWYKNFADGKWRPALRLTDGRGLQKYPAAVQLGKGIIRLFWSALEENVWNLKTASFIGKEWGNSKTILESPFHDLEPTVFVEPGLSAGIWLFWSSRRADRWHVWYSRFDRKKWADPKPLTTGDVNDRKPAAVFFDNKIWVFWSRKTPNGWSLFYRTTQNVNFDELKWDPEVELSQRPPKTSYDDAEPCVLCTHIGILDLYWRSNRTGADNIWFRSYQTGPEEAWQAEQQITFGADSCQGPAVLDLSMDTTWLWYRSSKSVKYKSQIYSDTKTLDHRYAGCTSVDTRNHERIQRRGKWEDDQTYTYDTAVTDDDWYARDTVGLYITPDTVDANLIVHKHNMLKSYLKRFLPVNVRPVYIIEPFLCPEPIKEIYAGLTDWYTDSLSERVVLRTVEIDETVQPPVARYTDHSTVDLTVTPPLKKYRTWSIDGS